MVTVHAASIGRPLRTLLSGTCLYIYIYWSQFDAQPCFTKFDRQLVLNNLFVYISTYNIYIFMYTEKSQQFLMVHRYRKQKIPPKIKIKGSSIQVQTIGNWDPIQKVTYRIYCTINEGTVKLITKELLIEIEKQYVRIDEQITLVI